MDYEERVRFEDIPLENIAIRVSKEDLTIFELFVNICHWTLYKEEVDRIDPSLSTIMTENDFKSAIVQLFKHDANHINSVHININSKIIIRIHDIHLITYYDNNNTVIYITALYFTDGMGGIGFFRSIHIDPEIVGHNWYRDRRNYMNDYYQNDENNIIIIGNMHFPITSENEYLDIWNDIIELETLNNESDDRSTVASVESVAD